MEKTFTNYWVVLKNGELRRREKMPKGNYVLEVVTYKENQISEHVLTWKENAIIRLTAHCGYDRGPRLERCIKRLWQD